MRRFLIILALIGIISNGAYAQGITYTSNSTGGGTYNWVRTRGATGTVAHIPTTINATDSVIVNFNPCSSSDPNPSGACASDWIGPPYFNTCISEDLSTLNGVVYIKNNGLLKLNGGLVMNSGAAIRIDPGSKMYVNGSLTSASGSTIRNIGRLDVFGSISNTGTITGGGLIRCCAASVNNAPGTVYGSSSATIACTGAGLPVEIIGYKALKNGNDVDLKWTSATEKDNSYFTIHKSKDGISYKAVATVNGKGTTSEISNYVWTDENVSSGKLYYQLSQTDKNGSSQVLGLTSIDIDNTEFEIFPNPTLGVITIKGYSYLKEEMILRIKDAAGHLIEERVLSCNDSAFSETIDLSNHKGILAIEEISHEGTIVHKIIVY